MKKKNSIFKVIEALLNKKRDRIFTVVEEVPNTKRVSIITSVLKNFFLILFEGIILYLLMEQPIIDMPRVLYFRTDAFLELCNNTTDSNYIINNQITQAIKTSPFPLSLVGVYKIELANDIVADKIKIHYNVYQHEDTFDGYYNPTQTIDLSKHYLCKDTFYRKSLNGKETLLLPFKITSDASKIDAHHLSVDDINELPMVSIYFEPTHIEYISSRIRFLPEFIKNWLTQSEVFEPMQSLTF